MRILTITTEYPNPSAPRKGLFVRERIRAIGRLALVKVICPVPIVEYRRAMRQVVGAPPAADPSVEVFHPRWFYPPFGTPVNALCMYAAVLPVAAKLCRQFRFDVLDAHFGYPDGVATALLSKTLGVPFVVTLRGNEPFFARSAGPRHALRWALCRASSVIAVSPQLCEFAKHLGVPPEKAVVIGNGVDAEIFHPHETSWRQTHGIPSTARLVVSAGSMIEAKGHHVVIRAVADAGDPNVHLVLAGTETSAGPGYRGRLQELANESGLSDRVHFTGWMEPIALADLLSAADLFCLASYSEGWPNVVHEAVSCGTPVVVTDVGSVRQIVREYVDGLIAPAGDQRAFSAAFVSALQREWDRPAIAAAGSARSWAQVAEEAISQIKVAIGGGMR